MFYTLVAKSENWYSMLSVVADCFIIQVCSVINYTSAVFRNKLTTFLLFEQSSLARNGQLEEFVYIYWANKVRDQTFDAQFLQYFELLVK